MSDSRATEMAALRRQIQELQQHRREDKLMRAMESMKAERAGRDAALQRQMDAMRAEVAIQRRMDAMQRDAHERVLASRMEREIDQLARAQRKKSASYNVN